MKIGVRAALDGTWGGIYQYSLNILNAAEHRTDDEFVIVSDGIDDPGLVPLRARGWKTLETAPPPEKRPVFDLARRALGEGPHRQALRRLRVRAGLAPTNQPPHAASGAIRRRDDLAVWWRRNGIGLMLYPAANALAFEVDVPSVITVHDLEHRLQPEFAEVTGHGEWERREYLYRNCGRHATLVLFNSNVERDQFLYYYGPYGAVADKLRVLPLLPAPYLAETSANDRARVAAKYGIPGRYLIYPGQFWPHKNHARIIQALERLKLTKGIEIPIVFCGSASGEVRRPHFQLLKQMADDCGVAKQIHWPGFVADEDMSAMYAGATALVMPTLCGPTATPPYEAWAHGCPVLMSNIPGAPAQMGDAAILVEPRSLESIVDGIERLWTDDALRRRLSVAGRERLRSYTPDDFRQRFSEILEEAKDRAGMAAVS